MYIHRVVTIFGLLSFLSSLSNIFNEYPSLKSKIPYIQLGDWPTAVKKLEALSEYLHTNIYLKDEGDCGTFNENGCMQFGGNKVRKLEFLLADAQAKGYTNVLTYGGYASNHMVATACHAQTLGMQAIGLLFEQYLPANLERNLLLDLYFGANLFMCPLPRMLNDDEIASFCHEHNFSPAYVIPEGGSNILGVLGVINAVFELRDQIAQGLLPEPDIIYVPFGSMGTTAGLLLGIKLAGLKARVRAIKVTKTEKYNERNLFALMKNANEFLYGLDETIPLCISSSMAQPTALIFLWNLTDVTIREEFIGDGYAHPTQLGQEALMIFKELENITLDQTYSAKAAGALLDDFRRNNRVIKNDVILFWNTYCSYEYPDLPEKIDQDLIPSWVQEYIR